MFKTTPKSTNNKFSYRPTAKSLSNLIKTPRKSALHLTLGPEDAYQTKQPQQNNCLLTKERRVALSAVWMICLVGLLCAALNRNVARSAVEAKIISKHITDKTIIRTICCGKPKVHTSPAKKHLALQRNSLGCNLFDGVCSFLALFCSKRSVSKQANLPFSLPQVALISVWGKK
jgi:hypothetical protein